MKTLTPVADELALFGGAPAVPREPEDLFHWPIVTREDEEAVLKVLRRGGMSGTDVTEEFERQFAAWQGQKFALGFNNGTSALHAAMYGCGVGAGDEIIAPSVTYWASCLQAHALGAKVVFADIDAQTLCIDPQDIAHRITARTKAIVVVHYIGHPADMDAILPVARRHKLKVIEDVSHAQGGLYKGRKLGTMGDVAGISLMSGKSFAIGEGGMLTTNDREIYERALAFGHYERFDDRVQSPALRPYAGLPIGGYKYRMHQLSSAVGLVQLKYYDQRCVEIRKAMNYFWDLLDGVPGVKAHRVDESTGSTMAGWYAPHGLYRGEELGGLSASRFTEAVRAEGVSACAAGCNKPLHQHPLFRAEGLKLLVSDGIGKRTYSIPWFKHYQPAIIAQYAVAFRKAALNAVRLRQDDPGDPANLGGWHFFAHKTQG